MTGRWSSRSEQLEVLLDKAFELDPEACERFLETIEPELRADLTMLLKADAAPCPLDRGGIDLVEAMLTGRSTTIHSTIAAGQQIGSYRLVSLLGEGGSASVWLAERVDGHFNHQVAVKCLKTGLATAESRTRFLLEQQIMAQMQHPYIARLYDAGVSSDNVPFIVMEWIDGAPLTRYCDERRLGLNERLQLFLKVCSAVAHAHQNLIVHRDLKPANILVGHDGEPRLLDFGIAKLLDESAPVTRTGMHMLTPEYAAPEQFSCGPITTATDEYMLGALLYELLCGLRPRIASYHGLVTEVVIPAPSYAFRNASKTATATTDAQDQTHPQQLAAQRGLTSERLHKSLRGDLDTIVLKALQTEPARRYATVEALSEDIGRFLRQQPISARKDAGMYRARKFLRRHAIGVSLGTLVFVALLISTSVSVYQDRRAKNEARHARTEAQRALATKEFLIDLFEVSDSGMPRDQVPTTQALLHSGAIRIRNEFGDVPEVKLDLLLLLGRVQLHLGQYASAEPLLREALSIAEARFSPGSIPWLEAHTQWANVLLEQTRLPEVIEQLTSAIQRYRRAGGGDSDALTEALGTLGRSYANIEHFDQAIVSSRQAVAMARRLHGPRDPRVQVAQKSLETTLVRAEKFDEAEVLARSDVALSAALYGTHHAQYADSLTRLSEVLGDENKNSESERLARQALAIEESVYDHPNNALVRTLSALHDSLSNQDKVEENESILQRWLTAQTQLTGPGDPSLSPVLLDLSLSASRRYQYHQAELYLREALAIYAKRPGSSSPSYVADTWRYLSDVLVEQHRLSEAGFAARQAMAIDQGEAGKDGQRVGIDLNALARVEMEAGHLEEASAQVDEALRILEKAVPADDSDLYDARLKKAMILDRLGRADQAENLLATMIQSLRKAGSDYEDRNRLSKNLAELGHAQAARGDTRSALASWNEALALEQTMLPADNEQIDALHGMIGQAHQVAPTTSR